MARIPTRTPLHWPVERRAPHLELGVSPRRVALTFLFIAGALWLAHITGRLVIDSLSDFPGRDTLVDVSDLSAEAALGTWFSSALLTLCAALLAAITLAKRSSRDRHVLGWAALSLIFLYLSIDEVAAIHEHWLGGDNSLGVGGPLYYAWVVPGILFTGVVALAYLRFLAALPPDIRRLFLIGAALLVGGAIGMEMVGGWIADLSSEGATSWVLASGTEETMEMMGSITFLYALMIYASAEFQEVRVRFSPLGGGGPPVATPGEATGWRAEPTNGQGGDGQS